MSFLTKLFVVLLVLAAMLLSATTVVFVQKTEDFHKQAMESENGRQAALAEVTSLSQQLAAAEQARKEQLQILLADKKAVEQRTNDLTGQVAKLESQIADLTSSNAVAQASNTKLTEAVASAQHAVDALTADLQALRAANDNYTRTNQDLNLALTNKIAEAEAASRALKYAQEQNADMAAEIKRLQAIVPAGAPETPAASNIVVNGVLTDAQVEGGIVYGTISVGSADNIEKGMKLNVVREASFIGLITITSVEPHEAFGWLAGPQVKNDNASLAALKGAEVKTRL